MSAHPVRATVRLAALIGVTAVLLPGYLAAYPFGRRARRLFGWPFFRTCIALSGLKINVDGTSPGGPGTLYVANHVSYLDIPVLMCVTDGIFTAKAEVRGWPVFGFIARIGRTVFVSRRALSLPAERSKIANCLSAGEAVFLFPEGSSSDGRTILPFRAGLISAALIGSGGAVPVQPVSLVYGGKSQDLTQAERDRYAWYGDMDLMPHLWHLFASRGRMEVTVRFHPPRVAHAFADRRDLAAWAEAAVAGGMAMSDGEAGLRLPPSRKAMRTL